MLYMYCLPRCWPEYREKELSGCVVYKTHRVAIPAGAVDERFTANVEHWLELLCSDVPARRVPSEMECRYCEITNADCSARIETELAAENHERARALP
jgi:hypothetical protein